jgi:hypothetical protein
MGFARAHRIGKLNRGVRKHNQRVSKSTGRADCRKTFSVELAVCSQHKDCRRRELDQRWHPCSPYLALFSEFSCKTIGR